SVLGEHHRQVCGKLGQCFCSGKAIAYGQTEPSSRGAKRRGDPGDVERPATPGLLAVARPEGRASLDALWLAMTISGSLRIQFTLASCSRAQEPLRQNGRDDDGADGGTLPEGRDAKQIEAIADHHHDEHADQRADDRAPAAIEAPPPPPPTPRAAPLQPRAA